MGQEKMCMTKEIVSKIHNSGGRFLRLKNKMWEEISTVAARDKVSHALRTKAASRKRRQEQILQSDNRRGYLPPSSPTSRKSRSPSLSRSSIRQHRREKKRRSTHDMFSTLVTPATAMNINHRRSHSQPKTYDAKHFNEPIPFHRSESDPFRQLRF